MHLPRLILFAAVAAALAAGCQKKADSDKPFAKVGSRTIAQDEFAAFTAVQRSYPHPMPAVFPAERKGATFMVETELLYSTIPSSFKKQIKNSPDWKWKAIYFPGQSYALDILMGNMGAMESDIKAYYEAHKSEFVDTMKVPLAVESTDSAAGPSPAPTRDSIRTRHLQEVRPIILERLFCQNYPPDSLFLAQTFGDSLPDIKIINNRWFFAMERQMRSRNQDFFLVKFIEEFYGETPPDSIEQWAKTKGIVTDDDLNVILGWLPEERRETYSTPERQNELLRWLLRWKVYAEKAQKTGYTALPKNKPFYDWAFKIEAVTRYVSQNLEPKARALTTIDTALCTYSLWDNTSQVTIPPDSAALAKEIATVTAAAVAARIDSMISVVRKAKGVTFLQSDYRDDRDLSPERIAFEADSLRDSGYVDEAEKKYQILAEDFAYASQGHRAFAELAKLQTEKQRYTDAIRNYRRHLISAGDSANRCNTFFMIGFIYDEYLDKPQLAEVNYKWVLKNTPDCELNDDAEFMMTHLDEPMVRIEDLRAEALRQGRNIDYSDDPLDEPVSAGEKSAQ